jgi:uncharacterized protein YlxP (DUF503 family)
MVAKKKSEGIKALTPAPEPVSIQEITMLDWYAMALTIAWICTDEDHGSEAEKIFDMAEALMAEREKRL